MKYLIGLFLLMGMFGMIGCASTPVAVSEAKYVPLLDTANPTLSAPSKDKAEIILVRGEQFNRADCGVFLSMNNKPFVKLTGSQKTVFYLAPGNYIFYAEIGEHSLCATSRYTWILNVPDTSQEVWNILFAGGQMTISPAFNN